MNHAHHHHTPTGSRLGATIAINVVITVAQVVGGLLSGSLALLSDALHNASDVVALIISAIAEKLITRTSTPEKTFGYRRAGVVAAMINSVTLMAIALLLIKEAVTRLIHPVDVSPGPVILLAILSIALNGLCVLLLKEEAEGSLNIRSASLHLFTDMVTSVAVLAGGVAVALFGVHRLDSLLSMGIALYLIYASWGLVIQSLSVLMQFTPPSVDVSKVEEAMLEEKAVRNIHHLHVWQLTDNDIHLEAHVDFHEDLPLSRVGDTLAGIEARLRNRFHVTHVLLQPEFEVCDDTDLIADAACRREPHDH
ncbi:cation diffusion facilitator family transporter [Desulfoluna spongiiphila]|uniref:Cobalt-zinc-cadmium efflux system protein n=1 Tax=Desulfoluna spongiiphila TaxID=419481 RepID=A0A1G5IRD2_9BACT|nr:cation diffusion facilitator family transporter [Desulfoluna spongiiphila]SCY78179.1 cobalt-zinc-cadmium efflux system protein [Desulfoluna spongiiphila]